MRRLLFVVLLLSSAAHAEEFLGVEGKKDAANADAASVGGTSSTNTAAPRNSAASSASGNGVEGWHVFGGVGGGLSGFSGAVTLGYFFNKYISIDSTIDYVRLDRKDYSSEQYGPEVDLVIRGVNPTPFTPFMGAGPGYTMWTRLKDKEPYDKGQSAIASAFGGIGIRLTRHFGLSVQRRRTEYFQDPPKTFADEETREPKSRVTDQIGFTVMF